jgi:hypothetical protein
MALWTLCTMIPIQALLLGLDREDERVEERRWDRPRGILLKQRGACITLCCHLEARMGVPATELVTGAP